MDAAGPVTACLIEGGDQSLIWSLVLWGRVQRLSERPGRGAGASSTGSCRSWRTSWPTRGRARPRMAPGAAACTHSARARARATRPGPQARFQPSDVKASARADSRRAWCTGRTGGTRVAGERCLTHAVAAGLVLPA